MAKAEKKTADDEEGRPPPEAAPSSTASSSSPSVWGSIRGRALAITAVVFLLLVIALGVALPLALLNKNSEPEESSGSSARQTAALEMELQGITYEQPVDESILESVCADFFADELVQQQEQAWENVECDIIVVPLQRRHLFARSVHDYRIIRAIVSGNGPSSVPGFSALLLQIIREGGDNMVLRLVQASQMFETLQAIHIVEAEEELAPETEGVAPTTVFQSIANVVGPERLQPTTVDDDDSGPYRAALDWILDTDPLQLDASAPNLVQRYLAAYFYFATGPWTNCGPHEQHNDQAHDSSTASPTPPGWWDLGTLSEDECALQYFPSFDSGFEFVKSMVLPESKKGIRWLSSQPECDWLGVSCNENGKIEAIRLEKRDWTTAPIGLMGTVPDGIHFFEDLKELTLTEGSIVGPLPATSLAQTKNLQSLTLAGQSIGGTFVEAWEACKTIARVNLENTGLLGGFEIPETPNSIMELNVRNNDFGGTLSGTLARATSLKVLHLNGNGFSGPLPSEIYTMNSIEWLDLDENSINGTIFSEISGMTSLNALKLTRNALSGSLPPAFPQKLQYLYLGSNSLTGELPDSLYELNLTQLVLSNNQLKGTLSTKIGQLSSLTYLRLDRNALTGSFPVEIENLTSLQNADFSRNDLTGPLVGLCATPKLGSDCLPDFDDANNYTEVTCPCCHWCCRPDGGECWGENPDYSSRACVVDLQGHESCHSGFDYPYIP